ncbi:MAG: AAA family ATPase, partial [Synergistaceae bacterium]|nr:AAA family ATPase [Synergistaceae bacterium]
MRFSEFALESFGRPRRVEGRFASRLTVVWGPNESGKTTLLNFIRRVLFYRRVPRGEQQSLKLFAPGFLAVRMDDGRDLRLEIDGRRHLIGDGAMTPLRENFLPVDIGVFERIFAIGLDDLRSPRRLDDEEVRDRFFSAGAGLGAMSLTGFLARMEKLERELYVPGGPGAGVRLNEILTEIQNNEAEIETWKKENLRYFEAEKDLGMKRAAVTATRQKLVEIRERLALLGVIARARPVWLEIRETESSLSAKAALPRTVPEGALARLEPLLKKRDELRENVKVHRQEEERERLRRAQMENSPLMSLLVYRQELEGLEEKAEEIRGAVAEIPLLADEAAEKEALLTRNLNDFAPRWSEADLAGADLSLASAQKAKHYEESLEALRKRKDALLRGAEGEEERRKTLETELALVRDRMREPEVAPEIFQKQRDLFVAIRQDLLHNDAVYREIRGEKMRADVIEEELRADARPPVPRRQWAAGFLLAFLVFLAGVTVMVGALEPRLQPWNFYGAAFCVAFALAPLALMFMERREHARDLNGWDERYER